MVSVAALLLCVDSGERITGVNAPYYYHRIIQGLLDPKKKER